MWGIRKRRYTLWAGIALAGMIAALPQLAFASDGWSWTSREPIVATSNDISDSLSATQCQHSFVPKYVDGQIGLRQICIQSEGLVRFGMYYAPGGGFPTVVGLGNDSMMYQIVGVPCAQLNSCLYVEASDMLITKQPTVGSSKSLHVYKNFSKRLTPQAFGVVLQYRFDGANPDYIYRDDQGVAWSVEAYAVSENGKWLAVEFPEHALGILNLETFEMKRFSHMATRYGSGFDPTVEFAVSNDGRHVAMAGVNVNGLYVWEITPACVDDITFVKMQVGIPMNTPCRTSPIYLEGLLTQFTTAIHPQFNHNGAELSFYAWSRTGAQKEIILRAHGYDAPRLDIMGLGDSYSSGEGELDDSYYLPNTNTGIDKCHVSSRSYPFLLGRALGIEDRYVKSFACSGAKTQDVGSALAGYWGQEERLKKIKPELNPTQKTLLQTFSRENDIPGRTPQSGYVQYYSPRTVLIGIGGNDAGLVDKLRSCVFPDECSPAVSSLAKEATATEIKDIFPKLVEAYTAIHSASKNTTIYAVGYPQIINPEGVCPVSLSIILTQSERRYIAESIMYLNDVVEAAARAAGIRYIDVELAYGDRVLCGAGDPVVNMLKAGDDAGLGELIKLIGHESYHPTHEGHQLVAAKILDTIPDLMNYSYCRELTGVSDAICPIMNPRVPNPSSYWGNYREFGAAIKQRHITLADDSVIYAPGEAINIELGDYSFASNSEVTIEVHSAPVRLAEVMSTNYGSLSAQISLPADLPEGFHTLHLFGRTYAGQPIDIYDVIAVARPPEPTSVDTPQLPSNNANQSNAEGDTSSVSVESSTAGDTEFVGEVDGAQQTGQFDLGREVSVLGDTDTGSRVTADTQSRQPASYDWSWLWLLLLGGLVAFAGRSVYVALKNRKI